MIRRIDPADSATFMPSASAPYSRQISSSARGARMPACEATVPGACPGGRGRGCLHSLRAGPPRRQHRGREESGTRTSSPPLPLRHRSSAGAIFVTSDCRLCSRETVLTSRRRLFWRGVSRRSGRRAGHRSAGLATVRLAGGGRRTAAPQTKAAPQTRAVPKGFPSTHESRDYSIGIQAMLIRDPVPPSWLNWLFRATISMRAT